LSELNPRQKEAVRYISGPLLVLAGAGSGKTSVITRKIAWLIQECGIPPARIAAVTFTNKAAREMKTRVSALLKGKESKGLTVSTFHTLGLNILRRDGHLLGYKKGFSIFDADDSLSLIRELMKNGSASAKGAAEKIQWQISAWKNALITPEQSVVLAAGDQTKTGAASIYTEYTRNLLACNTLDFDDLILQPLRLLQSHPDTLTQWQHRIHYLLVDEYQDTNTCQYELVKLIVRPRNALTVVGDDDQSVYAWRGAQPENLVHLQNDFSDLKVVKLEQNYRSTGRILKAANALIGNNPHIFEKRLWSDLGFGDPIKVMQSRDDEHEAERVVSQLLHHKFTQRTDFKDYALLYRGNHQARLFERALREQRIPYYLSGGTSFFERTEIRDLMAYFRLISNPDDNNAFLRVANTPRREIGTGTLEKLGTYATQRSLSLMDASFELGLTQHLNERQLSALQRFTQWVVETADLAKEEDAATLARKIITDIHYEQWLEETCDNPQAAEKRMENVLELAAWMQRITTQDEDKSFADAVARISLLGMLDTADDSSGDQVMLMTLHAAKGLEFPHVFIVGMEEGLLPHRVSMDEDSIEEERRLAYVGITRARKSLTFSLAKKRKRYGETILCEASRFLAELPAEDLQWEGGDQPIDPAEKQGRADAHLANLRGLLG
jgi:ATP-dependent DNA helicase Rep